MGEPLEGGGRREPPAEREEEANPQPRERGCQPPPEGSEGKPPPKGEARSVLCVVVVVVVEWFYCSKRISIVRSADLSDFLFR